MIRGINIAPGFRPTADFEAQFTLLDALNVSVCRMHLTDYLSGWSLNRPALDSLLTAAQKHGKRLILTIPSTLNIEQTLFVWTQILENFCYHPAIFSYGLVNEPRYAPYFGNQWAAFSKVLVALVRYFDKTTPINVEEYAAGQWALIDDPGVIYETHHYAPYPFTHQGVDPTKPVGPVYPGTRAYDDYYGRDVVWDRQQLFAHFSAIKKWSDDNKAPIMIGEFSVTDQAQGDTTWIQDSVDAFEHYGFDWMWHCWYGNSGDGFRHWEATGNRLKALGNSFAP